MTDIHGAETGTQPVQIRAGTATLVGDLTTPPDPTGLVLFAHGSGSSRLSPRNRLVAQALNRAGFATLLMDLLTTEEERADAVTGHLRFDIDLLATRLIAAIDWQNAAPVLRALPLGCFGASTGAAAALIAAAERPEQVTAVVSRGGRPDLAGAALGRVSAPTLLIVGGRDPIVLNLNREAMTRLRAETRLELVSGATHLFEEPGALEQIADLAAAWFGRCLHPGDKEQGDSIATAVERSTTVQQ